MDLMIQAFLFGLNFLNSVFIIIEQKHFNDEKEKLLGINTYKDESLKIKSQITKDISKKTNKIKGIIEPLIETRIAEETELSRINN